MTKPNKHSRLAYLLWKDRIETINAEGDWKLHRSLLGWVRHFFRTAWRSNHWFITGLFSALCAVGASIITAHVTAKDHHPVQAEQEPGTSPGRIGLLPTSVSWGVP